MALFSANALLYQKIALNTLCFRPHKLSDLISCPKQFGASNLLCSASTPLHEHRIYAVQSAVDTTAINDVDQFPSSEISPASWSEFAANVSGEWDGFGADFTPEGNPVELPEQVVPEAYREWEVKVFDWQTQCPTLARPDDPSLVYKNIKLLPTVGCEADAATKYSIEEKILGASRKDMSAFAYHPSGSYAAVWQLRDGWLEIEHCLTDPKDKESRVRVYQVVRLDGTRMVLQGIRIFCELWYGPFRDGDQLGGCAIRDTGFASTAATKASQVVGHWEGRRAVARFDGNPRTSIQELVDNEMRKSFRDESNLILLPRQLWCSLKEWEDGVTRCELGWLSKDGDATTSRCDFSDDVKLKEISIAQETTVCES